MEISILTNGIIKIESRDTDIREVHTVSGKKNTFWEAGFGSVAYLNGSSSFNSVGNRITTKYSNAVKDVYDFYKK